MPTLKNGSYLILRSTGTCIQINPSKSIILIFLLPYARPSVQSIAQLEGKKRKTKQKGDALTLKGNSYSREEHFC